MNKPTEQKEVLGIFITKNEVANLNMEHIHVSDFAIQTILKQFALLLKFRQRLLIRWLNVLQVTSN